MNAQQSSYLSSIHHVMSHVTRDIFIQIYTEKIMKILINKYKNLLINYYFLLFILYFNHADLYFFSCEICHY